MAGATKPTWLRRPVAVLLSRFPTVTETFILRELVEMERQGQPVVLVPMIREWPDVIHPDARPWMGRVLSASFVSADVALANVRMLIRRPLRYAAALGRVLTAAAPSWNFLVRTAVLFPKSVWLAERLEAMGVHHLHAHFATHPTTMALIVARLTGASFSFTVHAHDLFVRRSMLGLKMKRAAWVRAISKFNRDFLVLHYAEAAAKTAVVHCGVDPERGGTRTTDGLHDTAAPVILSVAALKPYKGVPVLVEACRILAARGISFRCWLVGDGPMRMEVARQVLDAGLAGQVALLGELPEEEVARLIGEADVCALASVVAADGQMDGLPVFLIEAQAAGLPVVASRLSGIPELVEHESTGLLVSPGDPVALADALAQLLGDRELRRSMGERGRQKVLSGFRIDRCVTQLIEQIDRENPPPDDEVAALVREAAWPPGLEARAVGLRRLHARADSRIAELLVANGGRPREVVLKVHAGRAGASRPAIESAAREHAILTELHGALASADGATSELAFAVPRPLHLDRAAGLLFLERSLGAPLDRLVREARLARDRTRRERLTRAVVGSGLWLRRFQETTAMEPDPQDALHALEARARAAVVACRSLSAAEAGRLNQRIGDLARAHTPAGLRVVRHHGDFWPGNVHIGDDRIEVIDFEGWREGLPYEDAAYFLVHLNLFFPTPFLAHRFGRLAAEFMAAFLGDAPHDQAAHRLAQIAAALEALAKAQAWRVGPGQILRRRLLRAAALEC